MVAGNVVHILDLYCGMGGLSLGFALALRGAEIAGLDIDGDAVETYNLNLNRFGCKALVQDVLKWRPSGEYDVVMGGSPCFPPDAPVVVNDSVLVPISELPEGKMVVTHEGRTRPVIKVFRRPYKGKLVSLRLALLNIPIRVTPNHPFLAYRSKPCCVGNPKPCTPACQGGSSRVYKVSKGGKVHEYTRACERREGEIGWVEAGDLRSSWDFVALKIPRIEPPPGVPKDPELWYLFGLYVADGNAHVQIRRRGHRVSERHYVVFYLGKHEHDLIERVKAVATRKGWKFSIKHDRSVARVYIWGSDLHHMVLGMFGKYADKKKIPLWLFGLPRECRASFLQGLRDGDGDKEKFVTTVNPIVAFVAWLLALSLGIPASLSRVAVKPKRVIEGRIVNQKPFSYKVREVKRKDHLKVGRFFFSEDYVWLGVKKVEWEDYDGEVFNLEVEEDHTYTVWGVVVHNCQPFSIANNRRPGDKHPLFPTFPRFFDVVPALKPKLFLFENVRGLLMRRNRHYFDQQLARVSRDYVVEWRVLNAVDYGVPQRRERLIVIGVRRDLGRRPMFPEPTHAEREIVRLGDKRLHRWLTLGEAIGDLLLVPPREGKKLLQINPGHVLVPAESPSELRFVLLREEQIERIRRERNEPDLHNHWGRMEFPDRLDKPSRTLSSHTVEGTKRETIVVPLIPDHIMTPGGGWDNPRSDWGSRVMDPDKPAYTITEKHRSGQLVPVPPITSDKGCYRRLTVRECLRVQSFPDWWRFPDHVSVSKRYRLVGEAVPPVFAYRLAVAIARVLGLETREPPREEEWQLPYFRRAFADYFAG